MRPIIGIVVSLNKEREFYVGGKAYVDAIQSAGGVPLLLAAIDDESMVSEFFAQLDGVLLPGGPDVDPVHFGEEPMYNYTAIDPERDHVEILLAKLALQNNIPILGICRGIQMLNVAAGGDIYQDIAAQREGTLIHGQKAPRWYPTHAVDVQPGTKLFKILGESRLRVNSFHHQAVRNVAPGFRVSALSSDGVIEGIEHSSLRYAVGVQWHPERMWRKYLVFKRLFVALIDEASNT
ncbi:MAG TPA: gamma-glutamyl-gamma-aminobutyrate hydrolase family protein [Candidatus Acetothermia bacterium]|nr:gamma-glutamyl-gamma-aminobutyrate hydrolase family protein [Candidatus Acetothermia bacterium]